MPFVTITFRAPEGVRINSPAYYFAEVLNRMWNAQSNPVFPGELAYQIVEAAVLTQDPRTCIQVQIVPLESDESPRWPALPGLAADFAQRLSAYCEPIGGYLSPEGRQKVSLELILHGDGKRRATLHRVPLYEPVAAP